MNGDGFLDLISANDGDPGSISFALGNGRGAFATTRVLPASGTPTRIVAGDVNGDGKTDLLVLDFNGNVSLLLHQ